LSLALTLECQKVIRPDLKIVLMSATIDTDAICDTLGAVKIESPGRCYPVTIVNSDKDCTELDCSEVVAKTIRTAHKENDGDILAFLPGEADIRKCQELLSSSLGETKVLPLFGNLSSKDQQKAIAPSVDGERKVVLSTPIAETSLTIEGIKVVVDSGLYRKLEFDHQSGLSALKTTRISMDMADQRSGRAGRVAPGICYRLWTKATQSRMKTNRVPDILDADLSSMVLSILSYGEGSPESLPWMSPPPKSSLYEAMDLLESLGAVTPTGEITPLGKKMANLPCHPRLSRMLLQAEDDSSKALACDIAAILEEKDPLSRDNVGTDISLRIDALRKERTRNNPTPIWNRIIKIAQQYRRIIHTEEDNEPVNSFEVGRLLCCAYPERVAKARKDALGRYILSSGDQAFIDREDMMSSYDWISIATMNINPGNAGRVFLACPVDPKDILPIASQRDLIGWDSREGKLISSHQWKIGNLLLLERPLQNIPRAQIDRVICEAISREGTSMLDFSSDDVQNLQRRIATLSSWHPELGYPALDTDSVLECVYSWLPMYLGNAMNVQDLKKIDLYSALWGMLSYDQQVTADRLAPTYIQVPTGSRIKVEYRQGAEHPVLRVRLQECFGMTDTPTVDGGKRPVLMELLSPGFKPVQLTTDLRSFWQGTYFEVRKELRMRYPKHSWPENPLEADPVRGVKKKTP